MKYFDYSIGLNYYRVAQVEDCWMLLEGLDESFVNWLSFLQGHNEKRVNCPPIFLKNAMIQSN